MRSRREAAVVLTMVVVVFLALGLLGTPRWVMFILLVPTVTLVVIRTLRPGVLPFDDDGNR